MQIDESVLTKIDPEQTDARTASAPNFDEILLPEKEYVAPQRNKFRYGAYLFFKRAFDIVSSGLLLLMISPIFLICLLIKFLEDFHNPIYVSLRVGKDGRLFRFYKIRSMCPDADKLKAKMIAEGLTEVDGPVFKIKNDPRITRFGRFLRKTSLDELPQLFNILNGTMSVIGPRSPLPFEVEEYTEYQRHRLDVKGGLLCLWQIAPERHKLSFDEWVALDLEYIEKQSLWYDFKILVKGALAVLFGRAGD